MQTMQKRDAWDNIKTAIQRAALTEFGKQRPKTKESAKDLNPIREKKRKALLQYKETQTKRNFGKLRKARSNFQKKARQAVNK